ncbi:hypothetical protein [Thermohalobacter berrensis]|uniref:SPOR domain-containing protein n=1 Tax=Thermohalobacter berrensis TaxID=99594 RepID=A0A419T771_9FIRM|nr:hypothetical protein [Thermohalobacter berrensis]RKD33410.1 hypothetical protein BET03_09130 [Thermohalobacter berrensis]
MWTAVHVVEGKKTAKEIEKRLIEEGFLVKVEPFSKDGNRELYKVLAPEFEAEEVQSVILDLGF